jgi:predicted aspartyl protease
LKARFTAKCKAIGEARVRVHRPASARCFFAKFRFKWGTTSLNGIVMRTINLLLVCSTLAAGDLETLRQLTQDKRFFELRRELVHSGVGTETLFYRGVAASRFGREEEGIRLLKEFLARHPAPEMVREAQQEISSAWVRLGRYGEAIGSSPEADPLIAAFRDFPPESAEIVAGPPVQATRNRLGSWDVPVQVNGVETRLIFDTGANFSAVCESEARRMGLSIHDSQATVAGMTGDDNPVRVASADVTLGGTRIRHVAFLIFADRTMYIRQWRLQLRGFLGLPAIRALKRAGISRDGTVRILPPESTTAGPKEESNLFFDSLNPVAELSHGERRLQVVVDTGAFSSSFYPSFRGALSSEEVSKMKRARKKETSVGGTIVESKIEQLPELWVDVLGRQLNIRKANFTPAPDAGKRYWDGWMGIDAMGGGFLFDFQTMRFTAD